MADHAHHGNQGQQGPRWDGEIPLKPLGWSALGLVATGLIAGVWMYFYQTSHQDKLAAQDRAPSPVVRAVLDPRSGPKLQMNPDIDLVALEAHERQVLSSWGWVNQSQGIVRMPISDAIDLVATMGIDAATRAVSSAPAPVVEEAAVDGVVAADGAPAVETPVAESVAQ